MYTDKEIQEARQILKDKAVNLSDEEVKEILHQTDMIAHLFFKEYRKGKDNLLLKKERRKVHLFTYICYNQSEDKNQKKPKQEDSGS